MLPQLNIYNAEVFTGNKFQNVDISIYDGKIFQIGGTLLACKNEVNGLGLTLIPGLIDTQVHFREPGLTEKEDLQTGSAAAVCGGVTSVLEMPNTIPNTTTEQFLNEKLALAAKRMYCNYGFFVGASPENVDHLESLEMLPGTPGIKIFMGSSTGTLLIDDDRILKKVLTNGSRVCAVHSEDESRLKQRQSLFLKDYGVGQHHYLRDAEAAVVSTKKLIELSSETNRSVHILHISTGDEVELIANAKRSSMKVTAEVTPQHLYFSDEDYAKLGSLIQMNPPIREKFHQAALWEGMKKGVFDVFGSDHAPHLRSEKARPYKVGHEGSPSGMPGVQSMLGVLLSFVLDQKITLETVIKMGCETPANLYGMKSKGKIALGYDADLVLFDRLRLRNHNPKLNQSKCGWSPYDNKMIVGPPNYVFVGGKMVSKNGKVVGTPEGTPIQYDWK